MFLLYIGGEIFLVLLRNLARIIPGTSINDRNDCIDRVPIHSSQDVANHSFPAPAPVAVLSEHMPDKVSFVSYTDDLETTLGRPVTGGCTFR